MAEEVKNAKAEVITEEKVNATVQRVEELVKTRTELSNLREELAAHQKDLANAETVFGVKSSEYELQKGHVDNTTSQIEEAEKKVAELSFKKSELKPVLDELARQFEEAYKNDTSKEYHIEVAPRPEKEDEPVDPTKGKKVFKQLLEYLNHNVSFTAKTAVNLLVLVRNMEENKAWVNSNFNGKGFFEARTFLECWANCGESVSTAVREIQKDNAATRQLGTKLNTVEEEFDRSEDDLPKDEKRVTTQEEVAPEVTE